MRKGIILGIGIFVILLALAGTGSAKGVYAAVCADCHTGYPTPLTSSGTFFNDTHKFDGSLKPSTSDSCSTCHVSVSTSDFSLTSNGSSYNNTHRYNATTLASVKLIGTTDGCNNCHVNAVNGDFNLSTGDATYLGSAICEDCHKAKYNNWTNTLHRVMLTDNVTAEEVMNLTLPPDTTWNDISYVLVTKFEFDFINTTGYFLAQNGTYETQTKEFVNGSHAGAAYGTCGECHTTGWNTSGWSNITLNGKLTGINGTFFEPGIGCERCHGAAGNGHQVTVDYSSDLCIECHKPTRHGTGWENGGHAPPSAEIGSCTTCHSPFDKYKNNGSITEENATNVACGVCHNTHDITDSKYADTFNGFTVGNFAADTWSVVADSKLSFFNATASNATGTDVFDDLISNVLIYPGSSSGLVGPINLTGRPVSEVLCSKCHYNHGIGHMPGINLTHANGAATCTDCHMEGANAKVGKGMMNNHDNKIDSGRSCGGAKCHGTSNKTIIDPLVGNGSESMQKRYDEWGASLHNDKEVGGFAFNQTTGIGKSRANSCNVCHDPMNWNPAQDSNYTSVLITKETFKGITCSICHNLHDMGDWFNKTNATFGVEKAYGLYEKILMGSRYKGTYRMVENTTELCGSCHSNDHPRLKEVGNYAEPGWPSNATNPNSPHGFPAAELFVGSWKQKDMLKFECTTCHYATMTRYENGTSMPQNERIRGHSFQVNTTILMNNSRDCYTCHITGSALGNLSTSIENVQAELHDQYNDTNVIVTAALADVKAYTGLNTTSRAKIAQAYWNTKLVNSDKSWGVHNPEGTRKLLNDAVILANEAVDSLGQVTSSVDLVTGWNLVALNGTPSVTAPVDVLDSVSSNITVVWGYNASASDPNQWELYDPDMAEELNDLLTIVPGKGYWINAIRACKWTV